jgi:hypothetical protein
LIQNPWFALTFLLANGKMVLSKLVEFWSSIFNWQQPQLFLELLGQWGLLEVDELIC